MLTLLTKPRRVGSGWRAGRVLPHDPRARRRHAESCVIRRARVVRVGRVVRRVCRVALAERASPPGRQRAGRAARSARSTRAPSRREQANCKFRARIISKKWAFFKWMQLWEMQDSRLYRSRILQVHTSTRLKALDKIYKINTLVHLWKPIEEHSKCQPNFCIFFAFSQF